MAKPTSLTEDHAQFKSVFDELVQDVVADPEFADISGTMTQVAKLFDYNVPHGKLNRGLLCSAAYQSLSLTDDISQENVHLANVLSWCIEILQAVLLIIDDIMDNSESRRGQPCWYKVEGVGPAAPNDAMLLENCLYAILKKHFSAKPYYAKLVDTFHDIALKTTLGQSLDTRTGAKKNVEEYSEELYSSIVKYKTSYYSFYLPVSLAMTMAEINDPNLSAEVEDVTLKLGHLFQVQDDYLDVFGDPEVTGKIGTDIQDGKCSWLVVVALQKASPEQKQLILENYGFNEAKKVAVIRAIYDDIGIQKLYKAHEDQQNELIHSRIQQLSPRLPRKLFRDMLQQIHKRNR